MWRHSHLIICDVTIFTQCGFIKPYSISGHGSLLVQQEFLNCLEVSHYLKQCSFIVNLIPRIEHMQWNFNQNRTYWWVNARKTSTPVSKQWSYVFLALTHLYFFLWNVFQYVICKIAILSSLQCANLIRFPGLIAHMISLDNHTFPRAGGFHPFLMTLMAHSANRD